MNGDKNIYEKLYTFLDSAYLDSASKAIDEEQFAYVDKLETKQQKKRDKQLTEILTEYTRELKDKNETNKKYRKALFIISICAFGLLTLACAVVAIVASFKDSGWSKSINILASLGTVISTVIVLPKMLLKYLFPSDERRHLSDIVKATQKNDLNTKKHIFKSLHRESHKTNDDLEIG